MPQPPTTCRRWSQFGLGTMFLLVTLCAVWLGWELRFIRERQAFLASLERKSRENDERNNGTYTWVFMYPPRKEPAEIPFWRRWLGDKAVDAIDLPPKFSASDRDMARSLFPEAIVRPEE